MAVSGRNVTSRWFVRFDCSVCVPCAGSVRRWIGHPLVSADGNGKGQGRAGTESEPVGLVEDSSASMLREYGTNKSDQTCMLRRKLCACDKRNASEHGCVWRLWPPTHRNGAAPRAAPRGSRSPGPTPPTSCRCPPPHRLADMAGSLSVLEQRVGRLTVFHPILVKELIIPVEWTAWNGRCGQRERGALRPRAHDDGEASETRKSRIAFGAPPAKCR